MASREAQEYLAQVRAYQEAAIGAAGAAPTLADMRAGADAVMETVGTMPDGVSIEPEDVDGLSALWCRPEGARPDAVVLYFHGGGYVLQSATSHRKLTSHLAARSGCNVLSVNYRLAPEHPHPAAVDDALKAFKWLQTKGFAPGKIAVAGDSAGGGLALAMMLAAKRDGVAQPAGAVLFSPWVDLVGTGESMDSKAGVDLMVQRHALQLMASMFLAGASVDDPLAAPLHADLAGLAPLYIQVGGDETLLDDSTRIAAKAAHAGVSVRLDVFPEMQHVFQAAVGMIPEATDAVAHAGWWLSEILG
ncbi:MAG: alpha/beta hydrolase [Acidobacteria bacterium]|nr:alpha/beta hydrolase [Acidobacteriota bacterium]